MRDFLQGQPLSLAGPVRVKRVERLPAERSSARD
jgi:hypothetical protein